MKGLKKLGKISNALVERAGFNKFSLIICQIFEASGNKIWNMRLQNLYNLYNLGICFLIIKYDVLVLIGMYSCTSQMS